MPSSTRKVKTRVCFPSNVHQSKEDGIGSIQGPGQLAIESQNPFSPLSKTTQGRDPGSSWIDSDPSYLSQLFRHDLDDFQRSAPHCATIPPIHDKKILGRERDAVSKTVIPWDFPSLPSNEPIAINNTATQKSKPIISNQRADTYANALSHSEIDSERSRIQTKPMVKAKWRQQRPLKRRKTDGYLVARSRAVSRSNVMALATPAEGQDKVEAREKQEFAGEGAVSAAAGEPVAAKEESGSTDGPLERIIFQELQEAIHELGRFRFTQNTSVKEHTEQIERTAHAYTGSGANQIDFKDIDGSGYNAGINSWSTDVEIEELRKSVVEEVGQGSVVVMSGVRFMEILGLPETQNPIPGIHVESVVPHAGELPMDSNSIRWETLCQVMGFSMPDLTLPTLPTSTAIDGGHPLEQRELESLETRWKSLQSAPPEHKPIGIEQDLASSPIGGKTNEKAIGNDLADGLTLKQACKTDPLPTPKNSDERDSWLSDHEASVRADDTIVEALKRLPKPYASSDFEMDDWVLSSSTGAGSPIGEWNVSGWDEWPVTECVGSGASPVRSRRNDGHVTTDESCGEEEGNWMHLEAFWSMANGQESQDIDERFDWDRDW